MVISDHDIQLASLTKSRKGGYYSEKGGKKQKGAGPSLGFMLLLHKGSFQLHVYIFLYTLQMATSCLTNYH